MDEIKVEVKWLLQPVGKVAAESGSLTSNCCSVVDGGLGTQNKKTTWRYRLRGFCREDKRTLRCERRKKRRRNRETEVKQDIYEGEEKRGGT